MTQDFWASLGEAYRVFSAYCRYDDWHHILNILVDRIVQINARTSVCLLDVGCGLGRNTLSISEALFTRTGHRPVIDVVEPSSIARSTVRALMPPHSRGGFLRTEYIDLGELDEQEYDAILFIHSTYYITNLQEQIQSLAQRHLRPEGKLLFLVLPGASPFFLDSGPLPNTAEKVELILDELRLLRHSMSLPSRFLFGDGRFLLTADTASSLRQFMKCESMTDDEFCNVIADRAKHGAIDFGDRLIIGSKG